jgi:hypothetical protein
VPPRHDPQRAPDGAPHLVAGRATAVPASSRQRPSPWRLAPMNSIGSPTAPDCWHAAGTEHAPGANCRLGAAHVLRAERDFGAGGAAEPLSAGWVPALGLACMPVAQFDPAHGARLFKCERSCWKSGLRSARFTNAHHRRPSGPPPQKMAADPMRCVSQAMPVRTAALLRHISIMHLLSIGSTSGSESAPSSAPAT